MSLGDWGPSIYFLVGPDLFGGGSANNILRGAGLSAAADTADS